MGRPLLGVVATIATLLLPAPASAQYFDGGSTGADGAFSASCSPTPCTVTVTLPASGTFHYTTVTVPSGITVKYTRNAANTPVTILATGDVTISGTIDLSGEAGVTGAASGTQLGPNRGLGGPGGFAGGNGASGLVATRGGDGLGLGGGKGGDPVGGGYGGGGGGGYLTAGQLGANSGAVGGGVYGTPTLVPLIGGSGGGGGAGAFPATTGGGGGGGGGAILIAAGTSAASRTLTLSGSIKALGGIGATSLGSPPARGGSGSGGSVKLMAHTIAGAGSIDVSGGNNGFGGNGGFGRTRLEAVSDTATLTFPGSPPPAVVTVATPALSPALPNYPTLTITSVGGVSAPGTLTGSFATPDFTLAAGTSTPTVSFAASNIPLGTTLSVTVKGHNQGVISTATSSALSGTLGSSTASASVTIPTDQPCVISATASFTVIAGAGGGAIYADGEPVERARVTTRPGGGSDVTYVTVSGRELVVAVAR